MLTVAVTLVPVVALLVDMLVETVDTEANATDENKSKPTIENMKIVLFI